MKNKIYLFVFSYLLFPIISVELFCQYRYRVGFFKVYEKISVNESLGLHEPFMNRVDTYKTLYGNHESNKIINFRTDKFGTIIPSSLKDKANIGKSILFCGGSTTENSVVNEGLRMTDKFTYYSSIPAINASKSGKGLNTCIKTITHFVSKIGEPKEILISTNVNTLMDYGNKIFKSNLNPKDNFSYKKVIKNSLPGIFSLRSQIIEKYITRKLGDLPSYEKSLTIGCCHGPANFNRHWRNSPKFDWLSEKNQTKYGEYIQKLILDLKNKLNGKYSINKITIFIEPNSYLNRTTASSNDYRQYLYDIEGNKLNGIKSSNYTKIYDQVYKRMFESNNFRVLEIAVNELQSDHFYDAVHLTPSGADLIGKFLADKLK